MATHSELGDKLGKFSRVLRVLRQFRSGGASITVDALDQLQTEIEAVWDNSTDNIQTLRVWLEWFAQARAAMDGLVVSLRAVFETELFQFVRGDINSTATSTEGIARDWSERMRTDSEAVLENVITTSAVSADADNTGDGTLVVHDQDPTDKRDHGRIQTAQYVLQCITDNRTGGTTAGQETFLATSDHSAHGEVEVETVQAEAVDGNRITNGNFDTWASTDPSSWTITTGAANIAEETTTVYRSGGSAAIITADGAATALDMEQPETTFVSQSSQKLKPGVPYLLSVRARRGGTAIDGTLTIQFSGTGYTPASSEKITITVLTTSYALSSAVIVMPDSIPSDFAISVVWASTPTSGRVIYLDDLILQEMTEWPEAALHLAIVRGATDFIQNPDDGSQRTGDYFTFSTTREAEGTALMQDVMTLLTNAADPDVNQQMDIGVHLVSASADSANYDAATKSV